MSRAQRLIFMIIFTGFALYTAINFASPHKRNKTVQENHVPVVKIISPKNESSFAADLQANYAISVSDKEDGESKYDEINTKEVLLEVKYIKDASTIPAELSNKAQNDALVLAAIRTSNCFNCHNFTGKLIGPSFYDITQKYPSTPANIALLAKRINTGSTGVWGKVPMPTHAELTKEQTQNMVKWIFQTTSNPAVNYYIGTEGNFRLKQKGPYILTASYIDHGLKEDSTKRLEGEDRIVIYEK